MPWRTARARPSSRWARGRHSGPGSSRHGTGSRGPTARTPTSSPTPRWMPSTSPPPTASTTSTRSSRWTPASRCWSRRRSPAAWPRPRRCSPPPAPPGCSPPRRCGAATCRPTTSCGARWRRGRSARCSSSRPTTGKLRFACRAGRGMTLRHPGVPDRVHFRERRHIRQPDLRRKNPGLVGASLCQDRIDGGQSLTGLVGDRTAGLAQLAGDPENAVVGDGLGHAGAYAVADDVGVHVVSPDGVGRLISRFGVRTKATSRERS